MKATKDGIVDRLVNQYSCFEFDYKGQPGGIDPWYDSERKTAAYDLFYNQESQTVYSLEKAFYVPFVEGKTITEVLNDIAVVAY